MSARAEANKTLVLDAFDTLFVQRDFEAAARYWSADYIQHSAFIEPGRDGLFSLVRGITDLRFEHGLIVADDAFVMLHSRYSWSARPRAWVGVDIVRVADGQLAEHWDVLQDEATLDESLSKRPMFGMSFPKGDA